VHVCVCVCVCVYGVCKVTVNVKICSSAWFNSRWN